MTENTNPNNQKENNMKKTDENNKLNYSFSPKNNSFSNSNTKNNNNIKKEKEKEEEKSIKIKKSITKGKILGGQFIIGEEIGKGTFGVVRIATHIITGEKVAVKMLYKEKIVEESDKKRLEREIKILKILRHKNIVHLYNVIQTSSTIYLVMEYIKGKELFEIIVQKKRLSELESLRYFQQLISGIEYLGKIRVAHRDLKPENLLIDSRNNLKIADFGLSNIYKNNELLSTACGSPCYAAPEMLAGEKYNGLSVDIWSSGIILYTMLCGRLPFEDKDNEVLYNKIKEGIFQIPDFLSENAKDFLNKILNVNPKKRYTISQIKKHPWFNQLDQKKYMSKGLLLNKFIVPIDEDIVNKMENEYEYNSKEIRINLLGNKHNHITTTYYLILKKKIKNGINSICDMSSNEFFNYIHNPKNLLANYNGDWNRLFKERGIKKYIERVSTFKSNSSKGNNTSNKNEIKNKEKNNEINKNGIIKKNIKNNFDENNILHNNKSEEFLIEKDDKKEELNNDIIINNNEIKNKNAFENTNNEFKEKIDELYKQKLYNSSNAESNNINSNENINNNNINSNENINNSKENINIIDNENINDNINLNINNEKLITLSKEELKKDDIDNNRKKIINNNMEKIISINLEENNKKNYTPTNEKDINNNITHNIHVNTISFSGSSNNKKIQSLNKAKSSNNSKNSEKSQKLSIKIPKFRMKNTNNSKSAEKGNKAKKNAILIKINKINIENKIDSKYNIKEEKNKIMPKYLEINKSKKKINIMKPIPNKFGKNVKKNNSTKILYNKLNEKNKTLNIYKKSNKSILINKNYNKFKSVNKNKKLDINKNYDINGYNNKNISSFSIDNNKSLNKKNSYFQKISIEAIYYAHKKNLNAINNIYNKISNQTKYKNSENSIKKIE